MEYCFLFFFTIFAKIHKTCTVQVYCNIFRLHTTRELPIGLFLFAHYYWYIYVIYRFPNENKKCQFDIIFFFVLFAVSISSAGSSEVNVCVCWRQHNSLGVVKSDVRFMTLLNNAQKIIATFIQNYEQNKEFITLNSTKKKKFNEIINFKYTFECTYWNESMMQQHVQSTFSLIICYIA